MRFRTAAVVIGVNRSPAQTTLRNAEHDAEDLAAFLKGPSAPVAPEDVFLLVGARATSCAVAHAFQCAATRSPHLLFVIFSGHGGPSSICLADGQLDHATLVHWIAQVGASRGAVVVDACHAGAFAAQYRANGVSGLPDDEWKHLLSRMLPGMRLLLASRSNETSSDGIGRNGLFTGALLEAFRRLPGDLHSGEHKYLTAESAFRYASALARKRSRGQQTPTFHGPLADFPIARRGKLHIGSRSTTRPRSMRAPLPRAGQPGFRPIDAARTPLNLSPLLCGLLVVGLVYAWGQR